MLARRIGVDYSSGMQFETSLINIEEAKELTMKKKPEKGNKSGASMAPSSTDELLQRISLWEFQLERPKHWPWGWGYLNPKQKWQQNMQQHRKRENCWQKMPLRRVKNNIRGHQQEIWYMDTVSNKSHQYGIRTITHHEQSTKKSNKSGASTASSSTYELLQRISIWDLQYRSVV